MLASDPKLPQKSCPWVKRSSRLSNTPVGALLQQAALSHERIRTKLARGEIASPLVIEDSFSQLISGSEAILCCFEAVMVHFERFELHFGQVLLFLRDFGSF